MARGKSLVKLCAMDAVEHTEHLCVLALRAGREEACSGEVCPLWEQGGCALERLTADNELFGDHWPEDEPSLAPREHRGSHRVGYGF